MRTFNLASLVVVGCAALAGAARGDIVVNFVENPDTSTVTVTATGSLQTAPLGTPIGGNFGFGSSLFPGGGYVALGPSPSIADHWTLGDFAVPFGGGVSFSIGTFVGPDVFQVANNGGADQIRMPANYISGTPITAASIFNGTFVSLNITPATVMLSLPGDQTVTYHFSTLPTPGAAALLAVGGLLAARRRRATA
ncbi:MAG: hypothetical protein ACKVS8_12915 [Phycisphaerales bacterium]